MRRDDRKTPNDVRRERRSGGSPGSAPGTRKDDGYDSGYQSVYDKGKSGGYTPDGGSKKPTRGRYENDGGTPL